MTCDICDGHGLLIQSWTDAPHDFAVCLCGAGKAWRRAENNGHATVPLWHVWCAKWDVDPARVFLLEDVYTPAELAAVGLLSQPATVSPEAALLAAGKRAKR